MPLTTLAEVMSRLATDDVRVGARLQALIDRVEARVKRYCRRDFEAADHISWIRPYYGSYAPAQSIPWAPQNFVVPQTPVIAIARVGVDGANKISASVSGSYVKANIATTLTGVRLNTLTAGGVSVATNLDYADYPTLSTLAAAIDAVTGWTAALLDDDDDSRVLTPDVGQSALTTCMIRGADIVDASTWQFQAGIIQAPGLSSSRLFVEYRAGYETIPDDLKLAVEDEIVERWTLQSSAEASISSGLKSESTLDWSFTRFDRDEVALRRNAALAPFRSL